MAEEINYLLIALITIFTSFFAGIGKELADEFMHYLRKRKKHIKKIQL